MPVCSTASTAHKLNVKWLLNNQRLQKWLEEIIWIHQYTWREQTSRSIWITLCITVRWTHAGEKWITLHTMPDTMMAINRGKRKGNVEYFTKSCTQGIAAYSRWSHKTRINKCMKWNADKQMHLQCFFAT